MGKERVDQLLVDQKLFPTREKAKRAVMAGLVYVEGQRIDKPGTKLDSQVVLEVKGTPLPFVSRGGLKLAKAFQTFDFSVREKVCLDIGASTGGFTDCLLQNGAKRVYAIDVGYGQLDWKLRQDPRVVVMERTNIRYVTPEDLPERASVATIDVAFISLTKFFAGLLDLLVPEGEVIALIKPQFEAGREWVGKKGVVRDLTVHQRVLVDLATKLQEMGAGLVDLDYSPVRGPEGNIEYLAHFCKGAPIRDSKEWAATIVDRVRKDPELHQKELG